MEGWVLISTVIGGYLLVTLGIGLLAGRRASQSVTGFVAGDRDFGLLVMYFITGATIFSAFAFLGGPGWAYSRGAAGFYILTYGVLGMAPFFWLGPKASRLGRRFGFVTQAQLVTARFPSRPLSALLALVSVLAFIPYITLQIRGAGIVVETVTAGNVPLWVGSAVAYGIVLIYVLGSGVSAVGWTNTFQGIFMLVIAWSLGLWLPGHLYGGIGPMFEAIAAARPELLTVPGLDAAGEPWAWGAYISAILVSAGGFCMWPHFFMKAFTARSERTLRRTVVLFPTFQLFLIPVFLIGFAGVLQDLAPPGPDYILPYIILETGLPWLVVGLFCAGALSASMSTGDALLHAAGSIVVEDGIRPFVPGMSDRTQRLLMRGLVVAVGLTAYVFALEENQSLVRLLLSAYGIVIQLAPPVIAAMYWKRATTTGVSWGLLAGAGTSIFFFLNPELRPWEIHEGILGILVHLPVLYAVSLTTPSQTHDHVTSFTDVAPIEPPAAEGVTA